MSENKVVHFPNENEFRLRLTPINEKKVEHFAILQYQEIKPGVFDLFHTEVPEIYRGRGIAQVIAKESFYQLLKTENAKLILSCTYLQDFYKKNEKDYEGKNIIFP